MYLWTRAEIEKILLQLDEQELPFSKYAFARKGGGLNLLGEGAYAQVYEARKRAGQKEDYVIKVIGFGEKQLSSEEFCGFAEAQKEVSRFRDNIIRAYAHTELLVQVDDNNHVISACKAEAEEAQRDCLWLQFIVMEKAEAVLFREKNGELRLFPRTLARFEEQEIIKLAMDIGKALLCAHKENILHRDVKLENIFYSTGQKVYKLGDFGSARETHNGLASTTTFTRGYGAPEVVNGPAEKYDNTADIYSLGMVLYVLLNGLRFPESEDYSANVKVQYRSGYVLPAPKQGDGPLFQVVKKMCSYDPDDRYQSMEELLNALDGLVYSRELQYKRVHKQTSLVLSTVLVLLGGALGTMIFWPAWNRELSWGMYLFLGAHVGRFLLRKLNKPTWGLWYLIIGAGIWILVTTGFFWGKLLLLLGMLLFEALAGMSSGAVLLSNLVYLFLCSRPELAQALQGEWWIAGTLFSLAGVLLLQYLVLDLGDHEVNQFYYSKTKYWIAIIIGYVFVFFMGYSLEYLHFTIYWEWIFGEKLLQMLIKAEPTKIGIAGAVFCGFWYVRERFLINTEQNKREIGEGE